MTRDQLADRAFQPPADALVATIFAADRFAARILKGWFTVSDLIIRGPR